MTEEFAGAKWIWLPQAEPVVNQYVNFRRAFTLKRAPAAAAAFISVDTDFVLYVNGAEAARGQFSDFPQRKTFTRVDLAGRLRAGGNVVAILAYYKGANFSTYRIGRPGMIFALEAGGARVVSDARWQVRQSPAFRSGEIPKLSLQLGFTAEFDAQREDGWLRPRYAPKGWRAAQELAGPTDGFWKELLPRPVPSLKILSPLPADLVIQGDIRRRGEAASVAETMESDALVTRPQEEVFKGVPQPEVHYVRVPPMPADALRQPDDRRATLLPPKDADGRFLVIDLGREEAGLLTFHLDAPAGTVLDIAHGEHLDDGRVRSYVGGRHFADRYICAEGENRFTLPRRLGLRYLQFNFTRFRRPIRLDYLGLLPTELPLERAGSFDSSDAMADRISAVGRRTLELCMHEHYEDCPWREQSLYAGDGRNQALYGYYAFGNYDFAAACYDLLGRGLRPDGMLELTAPAKPRVVIPCYSLIWITALAEHWLYSGDPALFETFAGQIEGMLAESLAKDFDASLGLYRPPGGPQTWQLYEWADSLAGFKFGNDYPGDRFDAPYNLYLHEALRSYEWMLDRAGRKEKARAVEAQRRALGAAILRGFWDQKQGALAAFLERGKRWHFCDLVQAMALSEELVPAKRVPRVLKGLMARGWPRMTFYTRLYEVTGLRRRGPDARRFIARGIAEDWAAMLLVGATSFWETDLGGKDFSRAASLCHAWSALPVYYYGAWVLGVRPLEPGFARFAIAPYPDCFLEAKGAVPTPAGPIRIEWRRTDAGLVVTAEGPSHLAPTLEAYHEAPVAEATYNGRRLK
ncbi:MAG: family 78 glycoside hydrolase catalytic domain [Candidatus Brocadiia bacterium]|jgi:hypothetical protein